MKPQAPYSGISDLPQFTILLLGYMNLLLRPVCPFPQFYASYQCHLVRMRSTFLFPHLSISYMFFNVHIIISFIPSFNIYLENTCILTNTNGEYAEFSIKLVW